MEYQRIGAWWHVPAASTDIGSLRGMVSWNAAGTDCWVVFGTLLGPEATGPGGVRGLRVAGRVSGVCLFLVSWLHRSCMFRPFFVGLVCGVCGLGLLFENYIVDASIFYKKQFPRI